MELRHLRYFVAVAEELHFGHAAERLRIAQPSLSQQIRSLEEELGVRLLQRTKRRVGLTDTGRRFLDDARQILAQVERMASTVRQARDGQSGRLSIGFGPWMDWTNLPELIRRFEERHPRARLEVQVLNIPEQIKALLDGRIDLGFLRPPVNQSALRVEPILQDPLVVALPTDHRLKAHRRIPVQALAGEPFVMLSKVPVFHALVVSACRQAGFVPKVGHEADRAEIVLELVSTGIGISLVPASAERLGIPGILFRTITPALHWNLVVAWRRDETSAIVHTFLDVIRKWRRENRLNRRSGRRAGASSGQ